MNSLKKFLLNKPTASQKKEAAVDLWELLEKDDDLSSEQAALLESLMPLLSHEVSKAFKPSKTAKTPIEWLALACNPNNKPMNEIRSLEGFGSVATNGFCLHIFGDTLAEFKGKNSLINGLPVESDRIYPSVGHAIPEEGEIFAYESDLFVNGVIGKSALVSFKNGYFDAKIINKTLYFLEKNKKKISNAEVLFGGETSPLKISFDYNGTSCTAVIMPLSLDI